MDENKDPGIRISQIFLGRATFEHDPEQITKPPGTPANEHQITISVNSAVSEDGTQGIITLRVETAQENKGCYRFMIEMVGMLDREPGAENMTVAEYLAGAAAAATMFPFAREAVANVTGRGRFGPVWLKPLNLKLLQAQMPAVVPTAKAS